jgi:hypothetical protein
VFRGVTRDAFALFWFPSSRLGTTGKNWDQGMQRKSPRLSVIYGRPKRLATFACQKPSLDNALAGNASPGMRRWARWPPVPGCTAHVSGVTSTGVARPVVEMLRLLPIILNGGVPREPSVPAGAQRPPDPQLRVDRLGNAVSRRGIKPTRTSPTFAGKRRGSADFQPTFHHRRAKYTAFVRGKEDP